MGKSVQDPLSGGQTGVVKSVVDGGQISNHLRMKAFAHPHLHQ